MLLAGCGPAPRPNVLLVTLDTTRADAIGAYGGRDAGTPVLDQLAARGARFTRAYTVTPLTIPAHSSLFTGLFPPRHGVRDNGDFFLGDDATTLAEVLRGQGYATMASVGAEVTSHHWGFAQGFDAYFDDMGATTTENRWRVERPGDRVVDDALGWLGERKGADAPWFAWVHLFDAHHPYEPPAPFDVMFEGRPYYGEVAFADAQVGRLIEAIEAMGATGRTLVVVTGDHGEGLGAHGEAMHGVLLYDATTRVPMLMAGPGVRAGTVVETPASLVDLMPTVLAAARAPVPGGIDGADLGPAVAGDAAGDAARGVYVESLYAFHHYGWAPQRALVTDTHKLIDSSRPRVYARGDDGERTDLAEQDPALRDALRERVRAMADAMTPVGAAQSVALSPERVAQLEALGYLTGGSEADATATDLADPEERLPVLGAVEKARQAVQAGRLAEARTQLEHVLAREPGLVQPRILLATLHARERRPDEALAVAREAESMQPSSQTKSLIGTLLLGKGEVAEGLDLLEQALATDPYLAPAWESYLRGLYLSGDRARLSEAVGEARKRVPDLASAQAMHGILLWMSGDLAGAARALDDAIARDPWQPFVHHARGAVYRAAGEAELAERELLEEIRLHPPAPPSRRVLVDLYAEQRRWEDQLGQLRQLLETERPTPLDLHAIGQASFNLRRYDDARDAVARCIRLAPTYAGCALLEANVLSKLGDRTAAEAAYARALELRARGE
ncbi:MAG: sulfatase-like hydrolase/transferase [Myxococcota bacterium]